MVVTKGLRDGRDLQLSKRKINDRTGIRDDKGNEKAEYTNKSRTDDMRETVYTLVNVTHTNVLIEICEIKELNWPWKMDAPPNNITLTEIMNTTLRIVSLLWMKSSDSLRVGIFLRRCV
ncbi:hypothetical protein Fot_32488 [Forsythia ovata]|uniref:Uncharacterized protein n=1 Tax=Forsythia ovata TaxID=205694 RepID=A0ABD1T867_9LAMI